MGVDVIGPDTFGGLIPWPPQLIYYGVFFGFGALCYRRGELGQINCFRWQTCLILSIPALIYFFYIVNNYDFINRLTKHSNLNLFSNSLVIVS